MIFMLIALSKVPIYLKCVVLVMSCMKVIFTILNQHDLLGGRKCFHYSKKLTNLLKGRRDIYGREIDNFNEVLQHEEGRHSSLGGYTSSL